MLKESLQNELDKFFKAISCSILPLHEVTDSAFCQARKKLLPSAFQELNRIQVDYYYDNITHERWSGFRLLAIDGSTLELPRSPKIRAYFGVHTLNDRKKEMSLARFSQCYDVLNNITVDTLLGKYAGKNTGEQSLAMEHTAYMNEGDLVLMDRNYPCFYLFSKLLSKQVHFCCRVKVGSWKAARELAKSDQEELITTITPSKQAKKVCETYGLSIEPIMVRFVKVVLNTGEIEILVTSLLDQEKYPTTIFGDLYFLRWGIEESYKNYKHKLEIENFTGKSPESVFQDVYAKVFSSNLTMILSTEASIELNQKRKQYKYKVNKTNALSKMKDVIVSLFYPDKRKEILAPLLKLFLINPVPIRPNRAFERCFGYHAKRYDMCYKRC